jgi:hypothetical protein
MKFTNVLRFGAILAASMLLRAQTPQVPPPGIFPAGSAQPVIENQIAYGAQAASITSQNVQCIAPSSAAISTNPVGGIQTSANVVSQSTTCPQGLYHLTFFTENTVGTNGGGNVTNAFAYHASGASKSAQLGTTLTMSTGTVQAAVLDFYHDGTTPLTFATTYSGPGSYDVYITLQRLQ